MKKINFFKFLFNKYNKMLKRLTHNSFKKWRGGRVNSSKNILLRNFYSEDNYEEREKKEENFQKKRVVLIKKLRKVREEEFNQHTYKSPSFLKNVPKKGFFRDIPLVSLFIEIFCIVGQDFIRILEEEREVDYELGQDGSFFFEDELRRTDDVGFEEFEADFEMGNLDGTDFGIAPDFDIPFDFDLGFLDFFSIDF